MNCVNNMKQKPTDKISKVYKVQLKFKESPLVTFSLLTNLDEAIGLALMLHAKSNVQHQVFVDDGEQVHCVLNQYDVDEIDVLIDEVLNKCR